MSRLKKLRKERGFSQIKMQMLTGIDQSDYSKIETGKRSMSFEQCRRVALALETSMDYLAGLTDDPRPYPRSPE
ncbi:helix-turn-helix domain-containing protein [uncultured Oscillibacter sp.]|uniref:helix-turn-helix domain-containing protein n=1 Tax=uncultured Oscillibacter sp. TaxID=876091 RepID=UPI00216B6D42|nr:helix-turn-helix transcriptional regulator [uncultured Oscillibacter sp.]MCI9461968.1 helix-turn-helix transcriptional regulator [Oscillibacter sp.]